MASMYSEGLKDRPPRSMVDKGNWGWRRPSLLLTQTGRNWDKFAVGCKWELSARLSWRLYTFRTQTLAPNIAINCKWRAGPQDGGRWQDLQLTANCRSSGTCPGTHPGTRSSAGSRSNGGALSHCQLWIIARCRRSKRSSGKGHERGISRLLAQATSEPGTRRKAALNQVRSR